jgi:hypothetical protein
MSREYYSKQDIVDYFLSYEDKFELSLFCVKPNVPHLFDAKYLGYDVETNEIHYQVQGHSATSVNLDNVIKIGRDHQYNTPF